MCFSAAASFTAGAFLLGVGTLTLRSARTSHHWRDLPFAAIPLLFAIQQLIEGVIWLSFSSAAPLLNAVIYLHLGGPRSSTSTGAVRTRSPTASTP